MGKHSQEKSYFKQFLYQKGLSNTNQRDLVVNAFFGANGHIGAEKLYEIVKKKNKEIGLTTVYRVLELLKEAGLASVKQFEDGYKIYEHICIEKGHHDHLVCSRCGRIREFFNPKIEKIQKEQAKKEGFKITSHRHIIFGLCPRCRHSIKKQPKGSKLLDEIEKPTQLKVFFSKIHGRKIIDRLNALGIYPNSIIEFIRKIEGGPVIIKVLNTEIALGKGISTKIFVKEI
jgi:Fur family ferric uptake transcriptional regulator